MKDVTPVEMLMLKYVGKGIESNRNYPGYWQYQYNVNAQELIANLLNKGFLILGDIDVSLQHLETKELKDILAKAGLKVSGKKGDLIERIINGIDKQSLLALGLPVYIIRSEIGDRILSEGHQDGMKEYYEAKIIYGDRELVLPILELIANKKFKEAERGIENLQSYDKKVFSEFMDFHINTLEQYSEYELRIKACLLYAYMSGKSSIARNLMNDVCGTEIPLNVFEKTKKYLLSMKDFLLINKMANISLSNGEYGYYIKSANDEKCCKYCRQMEGVFFKASEANLGITYPPFEHCENDFCRCRVSTTLITR